MLASNRRDVVSQVLTDAVSNVLTSTCSVICTAVLFDARTEKCDSKAQNAVVSYCPFTVWNNGRLQWQIIPAGAEFQN